MSSLLPSSADADLRTDRLILRPWSPDEIATVLHGSRLDHWAEDFPAEGDQVVAGLIGRNADWLGAYGHRLVVERGSGLVVGSVGLFWPPTDGALELGYGIVPTRRGRGYAPEAARALAEFALTAPDVHTVQADVETANPSSVRVLEKAGFQEIGRQDGVARFHVTKRRPNRR
ncbi:GNAT family N-acetyltransferase [Streptomyces sp. NBC_00076]|uniref:GNAT family N-acetyltransferase n=1 Tax=Streptomyces sp. NBC_00076 TaxID=2975642 RepID=UPI0032461BCB